MNQSWFGSVSLSMFSSKQLRTVQWRCAVEVTVDERVSREAGNNDIQMFSVYIQWQYFLN